MSHYDYKQNKVIRCAPKQVEGYPNWWAVDCGCSGGLQWGGEYPRECGDCNNGTRYIHLPTRTVAAWPGGPLLGAKASDDEMRPLLAAAESQEDA